MIAYFDTSGLVPLLIEEPGSEPAGRAWDAATHVASVRLIYVEARAALARAERLGRLSPADVSSTVAALDGLYVQLDLIDVDDQLVRRAGHLAEQHALRGYDAVHLAAAERVAEATTILVAGDHELRDAGRALGLAVVDTSIDRERL